MVALIEAASLLGQSGGDIRDNTKNVIFICVFLLAVIAGIIWWLRRG